MDTSADFRLFWAETDPRSYGAGAKRVTHPGGGTINLEYAAFAITGASGLTVIVFTPSSAKDIKSVNALMPAV